MVSRCFSHQAIVLTRETAGQTEERKKAHNLQYKQAAGESIELEVPKMVMMDASHLELDHNSNPISLL